jgi:hypothetical protein
MTPQQALSVIEQMRMNFQCTGKEADTIREAVLVIAEFVSRHNSDSDGKEAKTEGEKQ